MTPAEYWKSIPKTGINIGFVLGSFLTISILIIYYITKDDFFEIVLWVHTSLFGIVTAIAAVTFIKPMIGVKHSSFNHLDTEEQIDVAKTTLKKLKQSPTAIQFRWFVYVMKLCLLYASNLIVLTVVFGFIALWYEMLLERLTTNLEADPSE